jgi:uncharacterized protein YnzC (UPF0291/DUF896 family)
MSMKKKIELLTDDEYDLNDELRTEYSLKELRAAQHKRLGVMVQIEPDVAQYFPDNAAVNEALRTLIRLSKEGALLH